MHSTACSLCFTSLCMASNLTGMFLPPCWHYLLLLYRTGYESTAAAQAAAASSARHRSSSNMGNGSFFYSGPEEFDAEEIFNAFFG